MKKPVKKSPQPYILVALIAVLLIGAVYLYKSKNNVSTAKADWVTKTSTVCPVTLEIPPKAEPYVSYLSADANKENPFYWKYFENSKSDGYPIPPPFTVSTGIRYDYDTQQGTDHVEGLVNIDCGDNIDGYTTESLAEKNISEVTRNRNPDMDPVQVTKKELTMLNGKNVMAVTYNGQYYQNDTYYYYATDTKIYQIFGRSRSRNEFVKTTTQDLLKRVMITE